MAYSSFDDITGEISANTLLQLVDDSNTGLTFAMLLLAMAEDGDMSDLTTEQQAAATTAAATVAKVMARASAEVDGYCSNLYDVPFVTPTPFLQATNLDITIYHLFSRRENVPENRRDRYKNAVKVLERIANGNIQLGAKAGPSQNGQTIKVSSQPENIFTQERMRNF